MTSWEWSLALLVLPLLLIGLYLRGLAGRLDRLHLRLDAAMAVLDARLERRATLAGELARSGYLDPASALLVLEMVGAAQHPDRSAAAGGDATSARDLAESDLSAALRAVFDDEEDVSDETTAPSESGEIADPRAEPGADADVGGELTELLAELAEVCVAVQLARRFANDAVAAALRVRRRGLVRALHLAGHAPWPTSRELDDVPPESLARLALTST